MKREPLCGLTTYDALGILHDDIETLLKENTSTSASLWSNLKNILHHNNEHSTLSWISILLISINGFILIFTSFFINAPIYGSLILQGIFVLAVAVGNVILIVWDDKLSHEEIPTKILNLLNFVKECQDKCMWRPENYPHLCSPYSPCITLQWTYRDGSLVNLPWALLCRGDVILLRPGQTAPGNCLPHDNYGPPLSLGDVYSPPQKHDNITMPAARVPLPNKRYVMQETPLVRNVREVLDSAVPRRAVTCYDRMRHLVMVGCVFHLVLPLFAACTVCVNTLRYVYVGQWVGTSHWSVMFFLLPASVTLPLLPLCFPAAWIALNTFGTAKISAFLQSSHSTKSADPFDDISVSEKIQDLGTGALWGQHFLHALLGRQHSLALARSVNPLHILGSVTALCCVDKKGILSWPNPTAEKVFFLRTSKSKSPASSQSSLNDTGEDALDDFEEDKVGDTENKCNDAQGDEPTQTIAEVLDLTHDLSCPFMLHFDDTKWKEFLGSLKPIGLAILLNTCNMSTQEHYVQFCSHVTCEALYNDDLVPVTNRRCLCELSKQIGFTEDVLKSYTLLEQLSTFRHVQPEAVRRDIKFARSLALATKLKLPFPHMVSVVTSEVAVPKSLQLFSQATGDIALDSCVDFWDGEILRILSPSDRKKVLDFYQRTSLTAYCTAFAYRPLSRRINHNLTSVYMELPPDSHHIYMRSRSPTPLVWPNPNLSQSIDSLLAVDGYDEEVSDIEGCFQVQCNQIFLGMVTMQYQAQIEMVQLIEQLEGACIRFVHFSKENELRSRVFSEKMGLESGWNCHISLLSSDSIDHQTEMEELIDDEELDRHCSIETPLIVTAKRGSLEGSKTISVSAPSAINLDCVKTKNELAPSPRGCDEDVEAASQQEWQSISCLTDSTEQSAPINFDMSNRAKLPRGIEQIKPHLENVDNVPLLVSLFTDCTPATTQQMIGIMQEYGEVVCVMGSSANADNCGVFLKADASVSVEPLYPQVCQKVSVFTSVADSVSPVQLSQRLNSLPCSIAITHQRPVSLFHLIMHARHYMQCLWNFVQFWVCSAITLSALQVIAALVMLPPLFSTGQVLWFSCIVIPLISLSLVFVPTNPLVMQQPAGKNQFTINSEVAVFALWCYGSKFVLTLLVVPLVFGATLSSNCKSIVTAAPNATSCSLIYPLSTEPWGGWQHYHVPLFKAQQWSAMLLLFHLVIISISFVHREYLSWLRSPFINKVWLIVVCALLLVQALYTILAVWFAGSQGLDNFETAWLGLSVALCSPVVLFLLNEFVKWQEIKANVRYEKRARLEFGTKLGMNSPF